MQNNKMVSAQRSYNFSEKQEASGDTKGAAWGKKSTAMVSMIGMCSKHLYQMSAKFLQTNEKSSIAESSFQE